jgi:hypothetical protein
MEIETLISQVKQAIVEAETQVKDPAMLPIASLTLTLETMAEFDEGAELKITVPYVNTGLDFSFGLKQQATHTIEITLAPPKLAPPKASIAPEAAPEPVDPIRLALVNAIVTIQDAVQAASMGEPKLEVDQATVGIKFVVGMTGSIEIVLKGSANIDVTHTLELKLGKPNGSKPNSGSPS